MLEGRQSEPACYATHATTLHLNWLSSCSSISGGTHTGLCQLIRLCFRVDVDNLYFCNYYTVAWLYSGQVWSHFLCLWKILKQILSANSFQGMTKRSLRHFYFFPSCNMRWQLEFLARASPAASGNWGIISRFSVFIVRDSQYFCLTECREILLHRITEYSNSKHHRCWSAFV